MLTTSIEDFKDDREYIEVLVRLKSILEAVTDNDLTDAIIEINDMEPGELASLLGMFGYIALHDMLDKGHFIRDVFDYTNEMSGDILFFPRNKEDMAELIGIAKNNWEILFHFKSALIDFVILTCLEKDLEENKKKNQRRYLN